MGRSSAAAYKRKNRRRVFLQLIVMLALLYAALKLGYGTLRELEELPARAAEGNAAAISYIKEGDDGGYTTVAAQRYDTAGYTETFLGEERLFSGDLVLVNRANTYPFTSGADLVSVYEHKTEGYYVSDTEVLVERRIMDSLNGLLTDFYRETGLYTVNVVSGYRSYDDQTELYLKSLATDGEEHTSRYVAIPGTSEHHTGLAVDFSVYHEDTGCSEEYDGAGEYAWIEDNSWRYGFVKRYSEEKKELTGIWDEPWHFRYVGAPHAALMTERGLCLEEYIELLKGYRWDGEHLKAEQDGDEYEIYYCPGLSAYIPENGRYAISGVGDGFVVTVKK